MGNLSEFLLDHAPLAVYWTRRDGSFAWVNQTACDWMGYSREELLALHVYDIDADLDAKQWQRDWGSIEEPEKSRIERRHQRSDGSVFPVEIAIRSAEYEGELVYASFVRDLTEHKRLEQQQASHQAFFRALFYDSPAPQLIIEPETSRIVDANPAALRFYGYTLKAIRQKHIGDINLLDPAKIEAEIASVRRGEKSHFEFRHRLSDSSIRDVQVVSGPVERDGQPLLHSTIQDVTDLLEAQHRLENYRDLIERLPVGIYQCEPGQEGRFLSCNPAMAAIFEAASAEVMIGMPVADLHLERKRRKAFSDHLSEAGQVVREEMELQTLTGRRIWAAISARCTKLPGGKMVFEGAVEDITERRRAEQRMQLANTVIQSAREGIVITDARGHILSVNPAFERITGYAAEEAIGQNPNILSSGKQDKRFYRRMWSSVEHSGFWQGEIWNRRKNGEIYPEILSITRIANEGGQTLHYVGVFSDLTQIKRGEADIERLSKFDPLTGLPNRPELFRRLELAIREARKRSAEIALIVIGLDNFKLINESFSHAVGDRVLSEVAERLEITLPSKVELYRPGSDLFIVLAGSDGRNPELAHLLGRIQATMREPFQGPEHHAIQLNFSAGSASFPADGDDAETLLRNAEAAMFHSKQSERGGHTPYDSKLTDSAYQRLVLESEIRRALETEEFTVHFQPIVRVDDNSIQGLEALSRWRHPERGWIPPDVFIPVAESAGLIEALTRRQLDSACRAVARLNQKYGCKLRLAFNFSSLQVNRPEFVENIMATLEQTGLDADCLELELTESVLMEHPEAFDRTARELAQHGIALAIDDFGTGFSSLAYLQEIRAQTLKIDRRFIDDATRSERGARLAASIIGMASILGLQVIAEGVETREQLEFLRSQGCDLYQGYLFSAAQPIDAIAELIANPKAADG